MAELPEGLTLDEYVTSLAGLDRREIIRQLISADANAQRLAKSGHRERPGTLPQRRAEQARHDGERYGRIIYFLRFRSVAQGLTDADLKLCDLLAAKLTNKGQWKGMVRS
jgi:hypothetical protein